MKNQTPAIIFDQKTAASYDQKTDLWAAGREALFSFIRLILAELPADARILCVGVGTGTELIALAQAFPQWQFTAVEPASAMLDVCRQKAEASGVTSRCTFHEGYLDSLPASDPFDAATCLLVSHFFTQPEERSHFFHQIASRLRRSGYLINSDLVLGMSPSVYERLFEVWLRMLQGSGWTEEDIEKMRAAYGRDVAALSAPEIESIIAAGGFDTPVLFFQTLFIRAWFSRRTSPD
ncbi:class I SAM-dependent methyltransferase [Leptolyngbya sp. FACHB-261]|uniref:class I SAM-dependent methyltransferase n=1 Tax=Leptolyngbya sp. FACHB-261 TaxID=2692806 RepID=UPI00168669CA|nr:class I SAM-dependent methyltransferase [Leptolyngbya sp. FACHB-261]MBD2102666.1 methyltransferase domain-containing protein [Leptolyngbya sp. FACHB-261]